MLASAARLDGSGLGREALTFENQVTLQAIDVNHNPYLYIDYQLKLW
jgi:hypothetical protein